MKFYGVDIRNKGPANPTIFFATKAEAFKYARIESKGGTAIVEELEMVHVTKALLLHLINGEGRWVEKSRLIATFSDGAIDAMKAERTQTT